MIIFSDSFQMIVTLEFQLPTHISVGQMGKNIQGSSIIRSERQKMRSPGITWLKNIYSAPSQSSFIITNTMLQVSCKYSALANMDVLKNVSS